MRLRHPCEHERYEPHEIWPDYWECPGGEFIAFLPGLTADMIEKALARPDTKWARGTIMDAAAAYRSVLILNAKETV